MSGPPDDVLALARERDERRRARDFPAADALRGEIAARGFRVVDGPEGTTLEPVERRATSPMTAGNVASVLHEPPTADVTATWVVEGWPDDVRRALDAFRRHAGRRETHFLVVDVTGGQDRFGDDVELLRLDPSTGWGAARNAGLRRARGRIVLLLDGSVEPDGDVVEPLVSALEDPGVGVCGPFGISTPDLREFHESAGPDVDAIEGYVMALRRDTLAQLGGFDERFRWYRTADIELCFRAKDAGLRCVVVDVPVRRHEHRVWHSTATQERDRLSKRNFYRFLERFRGRTDLLVGPRDDGG